MGLADSAKQHASSVRMLQFSTIDWMDVELGVALFAGVRACRLRCQPLLGRAKKRLAAETGVELYVRPQRSTTSAPKRRG